MPILTLPTALHRPEVVARWTVAADAGTEGACDECGTPAVIGQQCPTCRQLVDPRGPLGRLAVATVIAGRRTVVIAERTPAGGWAPVRRWTPEPRTA
jgi:hypothetical protein